jgi:hypothetical protein
MQAQPLQQALQASGPAAFAFAPVPGPADPPAAWGSGMFKRRVSSPSFPTLAASLFALALTLRGRHGREECRRRHEGPLPPRRRSSIRCVRTRWPRPAMSGAAAHPPPRSDIDVAAVTAHVKWAFVVSKTRAAACSYASPLRAYGGSDAASIAPPPLS